MLSAKELSWAAVVCLVMCAASTAQGQTEKAAPARPAAKRAAGKERASREKPLSSKPKLVVLIVVDQMRADYVDKFRGQWSGGLKRMVDEGAWFHEAAYPYAATETCVGHSTISTGAFPAEHGMVANAWWDREAKKSITCTSDPKAKNSGYAGISVKGGDSAWRMQIPSFAEELKFQTGAATRIVTFSLKARAAITMAGHRADAATWLDGKTGALTTSNIYGAMPFIDDFAKKHPVAEDLGKTWNLSLPQQTYWYDEKTASSGPPAGWEKTFPHVLTGKDSGKTADGTFFEQWASSPYADTYLTHLAETAVSSLGLGKAGGTDFLGVSYSSVDYVGHAFGPRSWEIQDILVRLDKDLGELFAQLDKEVGRGNYVVALSADHGVSPIPEELAKAGMDAGWLNMADVRAKVDHALEGLGYPKAPVEGVENTDLYLAPGVYDRLKTDPAALKAVTEAALSVPGALTLYTSDELRDLPASNSPLRTAFASGYFPGRSGDLFVVPKPYWPGDYTAPGEQRDGGTTHGTPYYYDQRVPVLLMGWGIQPGDYYEAVTPADIAPTLASLCGITLSTSDGHALAEAVQKAPQPAEPVRRVKTP